MQPTQPNHVLQYVTYTRVSTKDQSNGLIAQERDIDLYLNNYSETPFEVIGAFSEQESGKAETKRPEFDKAVALCKATGATLLVSKLDRLSRSVEVIAGLIKKINFRISNLPRADTFQIHIYAALAEQERQFISERTKAALKVVKSRGVKLGNPNAKSHAKNIQRQGVAAIVKRADEYTTRLLHIVQPLRDSKKPYSAIARILNIQEIKTPRGKEFNPTSVKRVLDRIVS